MYPIIIHETETKAKRMAWHLMMVAVRCKYLTMREAMDLRKAGYTLDPMASIEATVLTALARGRMDRGTALDYLGSLPS